MDVGDTGDLWVSDATTTVDGHSHGFDINGDGLVVTRLLDSQGRNADISGDTITHIVFKKIVA